MVLFVTSLLFLINSIICHISYPNFPFLFADPEASTTNRNVPSVATADHGPRPEVIARRNAPIVAVQDIAVENAPTRDLPPVRVIVATVVSLVQFRVHIPRIVAEDLDVIILAVRFTEDATMALVRIQTSQSVWAFLD